MQTILIKCVQSLCVALLFANIHCDDIPLDASQDDFLLNREAGCTATCMMENVTTVCMNFIE